MIATHRSAVECRTNVDVDVWRYVPIPGVAQDQLFFHEPTRVGHFIHDHRQSFHNLVVTSGLNFIRDLLNSGGTGITHFGYGTSATAVSAGDTALVAQVARDTLTSKTATSAQLVCKYYLNTLTGNGNTIREMGLFSASVAGTMYARAILASPITKTSAIAATFTWTLTWTAV